MRNIVFTFTGTGNSLKAARDIAASLGDCGVVSMGRGAAYDLAEGYDSIGFVFPTYFRGEPRKVRAFIKRLNLERNKNTYYYAVATAGGRDGNALRHIHTLLQRKGIALHYAKALKMFPNYILAYDMRDTAAEEAQKSDADLQPILAAIRSRETNPPPRLNLPEEIAYRAWAALAPKLDRNYNVSADCIACGICAKVCPVNNIGIGGDGRPYFQHHCEQCLACLQFCPKQAINYKNKTQGKRRYTHPAVTFKDLAALNSKG